MLRQKVRQPTWRKRTADSQPQAPQSGLSPDVTARVPDVQVRTPCELEDTQRLHPRGWREPLQQGPARRQLRPRAANEMSSKPGNHKMGAGGQAVVPAKQPGQQSKRCGGPRACKQTRRHTMHTSGSVRAQSSGRGWLVVRRRTCAARQNPGRGHRNAIIMKCPGVARPALLVTLQSAHSQKP